MATCFRLFCIIAVFVLISGEKILGRDYLWWDPGKTFNWNSANWLVTPIHPIIGKIEVDPSVGLSSPPTFLDTVRIDSAIRIDADPSAPENKLPVTAYKHLFLGNVTGAKQGGLLIAGGVLQGEDAVVGEKMSDVAPEDAAMVVVDGGVWDNLHRLSIGGSADGKLVILNGRVSTRYIMVGEDKAMGFLQMNGGVLETESIIGDLKKGYLKVTAGIIKALKPLPPQNSGEQKLEGEQLLISGFRGIELKDQGLTVDTQGNTITMDCDLQGEGSFVLDGGGKLTLVGRNKYRGGTKVFSGTLQGNTDSLEGEIDNKSDLVFKQSGEGTFKGTIFGNGNLIVNSLRGKLNFDTSQGYAHSPIRSTIIEAGELSLNGELYSGSLLINPNGILSGSNTLIGNLEHLGTFNPGNNGIGSFFIRGDYLGKSNHQGSPNSFLNIQIAGVNSNDCIYVTGNAYLDGIYLKVEFLNNFLLGPEDSLTILKARGEVIGKFSTDSNLPFQVNYDRTTVKLSGLTMQPEPSDNIENKQPDVSGPQLAQIQSPEAQSTPKPTPVPHNADGDNAEIQQQQGNSIPQPTPGDQQPAPKDQQLEPSDNIENKQLEVNGPQLAGIQQPQENSIPQPTPGDQQPIPKDQQLEPSDNIENKQPGVNGPQLAQIQLPVVQSTPQPTPFPPNADGDDVGIQQEIKNPQDQLGNTQAALQTKANELNNNNNGLTTNGVAVQKQKHLKQNIKDLRNQLNNKDAMLRKVTAALNKQKKLHNALNKQQKLLALQEDELNDQKKAMEEALNNQGALETNQDVFDKHKAGVQVREDEFNDQKIVLQEKEYELNDQKKAMEEALNNQGALETNQDILDKHKAGVQVREDELNDQKVVLQEKEYELNDQKAALEEEKKHLAQKAAVATNEIGEEVSGEHEVTVNDFMQIITTPVPNVLERRPTTVISPNGIMSGVETIRGDLINSGILAPELSGNGLTIHGNYTQKANGSMVIQIESHTRYDRIKAEGGIQLDGSLEVHFLNGFVPNEGSEFMFLTAGEGIYGTFSSTNIPEGFPLEIIYHPNNVKLVVLSGPQIVENAVMTKDLRAATFTTAVLRTPLEELLPLININIKDILFNAANTQYGQLTSRLAALRSGVSGLSLPDLTEEPMAEALSKHESKIVHKQEAIVAYLQPEPSRWDIFATASGIFSKINNVRDLPTLNAITGYFNTGIDYHFSENISAGVYGGYQSTKAWYDDGSSLRNNGVKFGLYGTAQWNGFYANAILGGGTHLFDLSRSIDVGKYHWAAQSKPIGVELDSLIGGGYEFNLGCWRFGTNTSLQYTYLGISSSNESNAGNLNTKIGSQNPSSLVCSLGGNISYLWEVAPQCTILPTVGLSWQHEFLNYGQKIEGRFANGRGSPFSFNTATGARNNIFGMAGIAVQLRRRFSTYVYYNPQIGRQILSHSLLVGFNYSF